jgi:hypothetical protein
MRRRLRLVLVLSICLIVAAVVALFLLTRGSRIDREHFEALRVGMTREEVQQVLGGPARNECPGQVSVWVRHGDGLQSASLDPGALAVRFFPDFDAAEGGEEAAWLGEAGLIAVRFGKDGRVQDRYFSDVVITESPWSNLPAAVLRKFRR